MYTIMHCNGILHLCDFSGGWNVLLTGNGMVSNTFNSCLRMFMQITDSAQAIYYNDICSFYLVLYMPVSLRGSGMD